MTDLCCKIEYRKFGPEIDGSGEVHIEIRIPHSYCSIEEFFCNLTIHLDISVVVIFKFNGFNGSCHPCIHIIQSQTLSFNIRIECDFSDIF